MFTGLLTAEEAAAALNNAPSQRPAEMIMPHIGSFAARGEAAVPIPRVEFTSITIISLTNADGAFSSVMGAVGQQPTLRKGSKIAPLTVHLTNCRFTIIEDHSFSAATENETTAEAKAVEVSNWLHPLWLYQHPPRGTAPAASKVDLCCKPSLFCVFCFLCHVWRSCNFECSCCKRHVVTQGTFKTQLLYYPVPLGLIQHAQFELNQSEGDAELVLSLRFIEPMTRDLSLMMLTMKVTSAVAVKNLITLLGALSDACPAMTPASQRREATKELTATAIETAVRKVEKPPTVENTEDPTRMQPITDAPDGSPQDVRTDPLFL